MFVCLLILSVCLLILSVCFSRVSVCFLLILLVCFQRIRRKPVKLFNFENRLCYLKYIDES